MFSNWPSMLQQQDFQVSNRDILVAARGGDVLSAEEIKDRRRYASISLRYLTSYSPASDAMAIAPIAGWFLNAANQLVECSRPISPIPPPSSQD